MAGRDERGGVVKEPIRLLESSTIPAARALLTNASQLQPPPGAKESVLASLGVAAVGTAGAAVAVTTANTAATTTGSLSSAGLGSAAVLKAAVVVGAVSVGAALLYGAFTPTQPTAPPGSSAGVMGSGVPVRDKTAQRNPGATAALAAAPLPGTPASASAYSEDKGPPVASAVKAPRTSAPQLAPSATADLAAELALLDQARAAAPTESLRLLSVYQSRYPRGALSYEASLLRIETLVRAGRRTEAVTQARALLRAAPNGPAAPRLRKLVGP